MNSKTIQKVGRAVILVVVCMMVAIPLYWAITVSVRPLSDLFAHRIIPSKFSLKNFQALLLEGEWAGIKGSSFLVPLRNSLLVASCASIFSFIISCLAGYALAMFSLKGKDLISAYILIAYLFPPFVLIIALFILVSSLNLQDTLIGVIILHLVLVIPYCTWMVRGYFLNVPKSIVDSAMIDGCSRLGALSKVVLPVSAPAVASTLIFSFTLSWQDLIFAIVVLNSPEKFTLPITITQMVQGDFINWGKLMAAGIIAVIPPLILYLPLQKYIVGGLMAGAVKQ